MQKTSEWGNLELEYSLNGANVRVFDNSGYRTNKTIIINRMDDSLRFDLSEVTIGESILNDVKVFSHPLGTPKEYRGMHKETSQETGADVLSRAADTLKEKDPLAYNVFKNYIPDSLDTMKEDIKLKSLPDDGKNNDFSSLVKKHKGNGNF